MQQKMICIKLLQILISIFVANALERIPITMVTTHPFNAESRNPSPQYYCYLSSLDKDAVVSSRRVLETRTDPPGVDNNPAPPMPVMQQGAVYPPGSAVYKVTLDFRGTSEDAFAYGTFSCDASRSGRADSTVSNILMNSESYTYPEDGLVTQTVNMDDRGVQIRMAGAQDVNRWHRNTLNSNILSNRNLDFTGMNLILNFKLNISKSTDEGLYQTLSGSLSRQNSRHGLKRLIVRSCPSNQWAPPKCYGVCENCYNGGVCDDETGRCICPPGFMGANCLTACSDYQFGLSCEFQCSNSDDCEGLQFCLLDPYGCSCGAGWKGLDCLTACESSKFGASCLQECNCDGACDRFTGSCSGSCESGWGGFNCQFPDVCPVGYYGPNFTSICNCRNGVQCDTLTGECPNQQCGPGYVVLPASVTCQECQGAYFGQLCQEDCHCAEEACNKLNGQCCGQCKPQWVDASQCLVGFEEATSSKINPGAISNVSCVLQGHRLLRAGLSLHLSRQEAQLMSNGIQEINTFSSEDVYTGQFRADNVTDGDKVFCLAIDQEDEIVAVLSTTVNEYVLPVLTSPPSLLHVNVSLIAIQWSAWDAVKDMGEPPIVAYIPYYRKMSTKEWIAGPINNTSLTFTAVNLDSDTLYVFSVAVVREGENGEGPRSPEISFRTHCDVSEISPVDVVAYLDVTSNAVNVSWQIPEDMVCTTGISFFNIYVEEVVIDGNPQLHKRTEGDIRWAILGYLKKGNYRFLVTFTIDTESDFSETSEVISIVEDLAGTPDAKVPGEVPDINFNDAAVSSTFITVTLMPVSTENGPISCYEFVVAERDEGGIDPDEDFPFSDVKENSEEGTPYRAVVMNHKEYSDKSTVIIGAGRDQESMCVLPGNSRRKRASELVSGQTLTARNDPLESAKNYRIFLRIYVLSTNGEYCYESSTYQSFITKSDNSTEMPQSPMTGLVVALTVIVFIIILAVSIAVVVILRRKSTQTDSEKRQSNKADMNYENEGLSRSTVYVNEQQTSNVDALSYEPVQKQASGGIQLDQLPRTLPDSKVESSYDYEVTAIPKQNTALPEPNVSQDLDKVIYEDMPDELNYSQALYSQEKAPVPFKVSELPEYIHQRRLGGRNALEMEFRTLPQGQLEPWTEAVKKQNVYKGRNPDVLPYDSSRVRLVFDSINHSDYYNASFIMDQHNRQSFIAAESPSEDTADAFLWMIWQEKVAIVVMVSDMNESAEQTCSPYWPMKEGTSRHYGKMSVALKGIKNHPDYSVRKLLIMKKGEDSISVTQFHYHSWPYRRVAEHPTSLLDYIKDVKLCLKRKHFPLLVHCSDGAGATGTFIGLFCLLNELTQSSEISIYHFVQKMRKNRINMVGTKAQYVFIYEVLLLAYQTPVTVYSAHDFKKLVINKRKLSGQFQSLLKPKYQIDAQSGSATENKNRNRFSKIIPLDVSSPHLQCTSLLGGSGYINACFANSHFKKNAFILTQSPLPTTVEDFWRMVYDQKSTKIIMLNMLDSTDKTCYLYWPSGNCQYGSVLVECTSTVTKDLYVCREMVVKHRDNEQAPVKLKHFQLLSWPEGKTAIHIIRFIEAVGFSEGPEPVVVHCIDGVGHSGVYVTIHNEMQRFKDSDKVDIFQTVQSLRERNPHVFSTLKDFLFCYEALQAFVNKVA